MLRFRNFIDKKHDETKHDIGNGGSLNFQPPPPLKISNSNYAHDDVFKKISLILLSRYNAIGISPMETINSTLVTLEDKLAFYEALCFRLALLPRQEVHTASLVQQVDQIFGEEFKAVCHHDQVPSNSYEIEMKLGSHEVTPPCQQPPFTPRNDQFSSSRFSESWRTRRPVRRRSFFPDAGAQKTSYMMMPTKIRNIDWQLASAVQQVVSLTLDGSSPTQKGDFACYDPPTTPMKCQRV